MVVELNKEDVGIKPTSMGIITTYQCTAACEDCCFSCSPKSKEKLTLEEIYAVIDEAYSMKSIKVVIFTGGEATLLKDDLFKAIEYAKNLGFITRLVSNAHWGKNSNAKKIAKNLKMCGLNEINFSTGDNHQEFVSVEEVLKASFYTIDEGIRTLISVETAKSLNFKESDLLNNSLYKKIKSNYNGELLSVESTSWVSAKKPDKYEYDFFSNYGDYGCDSLFNDITIDASGKVYSCCGLSVRTIEEMNLGNIRDDKTVSSCYESQFQDLLKKWIFVEGPYNVLKKVSFWNSSIKVPKYAHKCLYCSMLYKNQEVKQILGENIFVLKKEILEKFENKIEFINQFERGC